MNIFVDGENSRFTGGLETAGARDAEVFIVPAVSGGKHFVATDAHGESTDPKSRF